MCPKPCARRKDNRRMYYYLYANHFLVRRPFYNEGNYNLTLAFVAARNGVDH